MEIDKYWIKGTYLRGIQVLKLNYWIAQQGYRVWFNKDGTVSITKFDTSTPSEHRVCKSKVCHTRKEAEEFLSEFGFDETNISPVTTIWKDVTGKLRAIDSGHFYTAEESDLGLGVSWCVETIHGLKICSVFDAGTIFDCPPAIVPFRLSTSETDIGQLKSAPHYVTYTGETDLDAVKAWFVRLRYTRFASVSL